MDPPGSVRCEACHLQISRWICQCGTVLERGRGLATGRPAGPDALRLGRELHPQVDKVSGLIKSERLIGITVPDIAPVAHELIQHFRERGAEASGFETAQGGWEIVISRGGILKTVAGLKTVLKIKIQPQPGGTLIRAGVPGVFTQGAPLSAMTMLVDWPEVMRVVEMSFSRRSPFGLNPT